MWVGDTTGARAFQFASRRWTNSWATMYLTILEVDGAVGHDPFGEQREVIGAGDGGHRLGLGGSGTTPVVLQ